MQFFLLVSRYGDNVESFGSTDEGGGQLGSWEGK